jgi:hypothetical protein
VGGGGGGTGDAPGMSAAFAPPSPKPVTATAVITASIACQKWLRIAPVLFVRLALLTVANSIEAVWRNIDVSVIAVGRKSSCPDRGPAAGMAVADRDANGARGARTRCPYLSARGGLAVSYWKVIMSVRLSVGAFGFKGWFVRLPLP